MTRRNQSRWFGLAAAALGAVAMTVGLPATALADHDSRRNDQRHLQEDSRHRHDETRHRHNEARHRRADYRRHYRRHYRSHRAPRYARGVHYRQASYYCKPCSHRFQSRNAFHRHLNHVHHVPFWRVPFVLAHVAFGWIFYG